MMIADYSLINEVILVAAGFHNAKSLSIKMTKLFRLCSEQLSKQDHYDFGMRSMKSILNIAGYLKLENPNMEEDQLLIRAMRDA